MQKDFIRIFISPFGDVTRRLWYGLKEMKIPPQKPAKKPLCFGVFSFGLQFLLCFCFNITFEFHLIKLIYISMKVSVIINYFEINAKILKTPRQLWWLNFIIIAKCWQYNTFSNFSEYCISWYISLTSCVILCVQKSISEYM